MGDWEPYFAHQGGFTALGTAFHHQVDELAETVFAPTNTNFDVFDISEDCCASFTIRDEIELNQALDATPDSGVRIISISSPRTPKPLQVTSPLAARLFDRYRIRTEFLRVLLSFGDEPHQSEANSSWNAFIPMEDGAYVLLYKLNFVERNQRTTHDPWSFRHVGVYHRHQGGLDLFILLHCQIASALPNELQDVVESMSPATESASTLRRDLCTQPQRLHILILSCYLENWRPYLRYLGAKFARVNDIAMVAYAEKDHDIWEMLRSVRDLRNTIDFAWFAKQFSAAQKSELHSIGTMLHGYIDSSAVLRQRIENTVELAGYTLSMRTQQELHYLTREMKTHIKDTGQVTLRLKNLTENTVDDSATVRIITIISAIYLPGSFVGTIFGSNFFNFNDESGRLVMAQDFWIFVALWLGLTIVTGFVYGATYTWKRLNPKTGSDETEENGSA